MNLRHILFALLVTTLGACGTDNVGDTTGDTATPDGPAAEAPAAAEAGQEPSGDTDPAAAELEALQGVAESDAIEEDEEALELAVAADEPEGEEAPEWRYEQDKHFRRLTTAQGTSSSPDKIEVAEVFWYGCPHCYNFEPYIEKWKEGISADVSFVRVPVIWNPTNELHARAFYTAEALGKQEEVHPLLFSEIHVRNNPLSSPEMIQRVFAKAGVSAEEFTSTFDSFAVTGNVRRAGNLTQRYGIRSVPVLVINGRYTTDASEITSFEEMLAVGDELVERERVAR